MVSEEGWLKQGGKMKGMRDRFEIECSSIRSSGAEPCDHACADVVIKDNVSGLRFCFILRGYMTDQNVELDCYTMDIERDEGDRCDVFYKGMVRTYPI